MEVFVHLFQKVVGVWGQSPQGLGAVPRASSPREVRPEHGMGRRSPRNLRGMASVGEPKPVSGTGKRRRSRRAVDSAKLGNGTFPSLAERADCTTGRWALSVSGNCRYMMSGSGEGTGCQRTGVQGDREGVQGRFGPYASEDGLRFSASWEIFDFPTQQIRAAWLLWRRCLVPLTDLGSGSWVLLLFEIW